MRRIEFFRFDFELILYFCEALLELEKFFARGDVLLLGCGLILSEGGEYAFDFLYVLPGYVRSAFSFDAQKVSRRLVDGF